MNPYVLKELLRCNSAPRRLHRRPPEGNDRQKQFRTRLQLPHHRKSSISPGKMGGANERKEVGPECGVGPSHRLHNGRTGWIECHEDIAGFGGLADDFDLSRVPTG